MIFWGYIQSQTTIAPKCFYRGTILHSHLQWTRFPLLCLLSNVNHFPFFKRNSHFIGSALYLMVFICNSLGMLNIFSCSHWTFAHLLWKNIFSFCLPICNWWLFCVCVCVCGTGILLINLIISPYLLYGFQIFSLIL